MRIREPFNGASHLVGLLLGGAGSVMLLRMARGPEQLLPLSIYCATLLLLYAASTLYHTLSVNEGPLRALRTLDHIAIYFLIAGTYTPIAVITLNSRLGWILLTSVWLIALAGIPFKPLYLDAPIWLSTGSYLLMGYLAMVAVVPLARGGAARRPDVADFGRHRLYGGSCDILTPATGPFSRCLWPSRDLAPAGAHRQRLPLRFHGLSRGMR